MRPVANGGALPQSDVAGQILILRTERVIDPRAYRRETSEAASGHKRKLRRGMVDAVGGHRSNKGDLIDDFLKVREQVGNVASALATLLELPRAGHAVLRAV